jgi:hypothetical protein
MEGIKPEAGSPADSPAAGGRWWVGLLWFAYLAWALPYFAAHFWPFLQRRIT